MSKIKKQLRLILCIASFLLLAIVFAFNPTLSVSAQVTLTQQEVESAVSAVHLPTSVVDVSKDPGLIVPLLNFKTEKETYTIRITDSNGTNHDCEIKKEDVTSQTSHSDYFSYAKFKVGNSESDTKELDAIEIKSSKLINGNYSITYIYDNVYSYPYAVEVKGVDYELSFVEPETLANGEENPLAGTKVLLPSTAANGQAIDLPTAYVKVAGEDGDYIKTQEDEKDKYVTAILTVEKDNALIYSTDPSHPYVTSEIAISSSKVQLKPSLAEDEESVTYRVTYKYPEGKNPPVKTFTIVVSKSYKAPTSLKVNKTDLPSMELGQKGITLPEWTASAGTISNVEVNITKIVIEKEGNSNIKLELKNNNRTFDFTKESFNEFLKGTYEINSYKDMVGNYKITYFMESAYPDPDDNTKKLSASDYKTVLSLTDASKPNVYMAYSYELTEDGKSVSGEVNTDYAVELKANYGYGELAFPAIYAEDLVNSYDELVLYRYFQYKNDVSKKYYIDNVKLDDDNNLVAVEATDAGYNASGDANIGKTNKVVRFKFNTTNDRQIETFTNKEYTLHYYVVNKEEARIVKQENNLYETGREAYSFKVLNRVTVGEEDSTEGTSTPTIKINDLSNNSTVNKNEKLTITVDAKDELDKRLKNAMFYYTGSAVVDVKTKFEEALNSLALNQTWGAMDETTHAPDNTNEGEINYFDNFKSNILYNDVLVTSLNSDNTFNKSLVRFTEVDNSTFETELNLTSGATLNLVAVTLNDNNTIAVATKTLKVANTDDYNAPLAKVTAETSETGNKVKTDNKSEFNQGENAYLPTVEFTDKEDNALEVFVEYYILTEDNDAVTYLTPRDAVYTQTTEGISVSGARIITGKVGTYYVVYTAIDDAGNQTFVSYNFAVKNSSLPTLSVNATGADIEKSGTSIKAETNTVITFQPTVTKYDGTDLTDDGAVKYTITAVGQKYGYSATPAGSKFARLFKNADEYVVTITATYEDDKTLEKQIFYVTITEPELKWAEFNEDAFPIKAEIGETVQLPNLQAVFGKNKLPISVTVKVEDPSGKTPEYGEVKQEGNYWTFKCNDKLHDSTRTEKGTYTVTYTATWNGATITKTFKIKVGDSIGPEFRFEKDVSGLEQELVYDGTNSIEYTIELDRAARTLVIKVFSNGKSIYEIDTGLKIYDKDGTITNGTATNKLFTNWYELNIELITSDGKLEEVEKGENDTFEKRYNITGVGKYTLVLNIKDNYQNEATPKEFNFNVVAKSEPKESNENVVGIVLIVVSLVILAGVILFFTFTGKKGGSSKTKSTKTKKAETSVETDNDAKSGDVE